MNERSWIAWGLVWVTCGSGSTATATAAEAGKVDQVDVFVAGADGYHTFRIPSVIVSPRGAVLTFCEGRKHGRGDSGDIDLVMKRSGDGGATWSPLRVVADFGPDTIGNPCPVFDRATGTLWMLLTRNAGEDTAETIRAGTGKGTRTVWVMKSPDDGLSWSEPVEITATTKAPGWTWCATGPGVSIQLASGRMLVPCDHTAAGTGAAGSHVIYSDDHGATWKLGGVVRHDVNECQAVELSDGSVLMSLRNHSNRKGEGRAVAGSRDGGLTWTEATRDPALIDPICQASLIRYTDRGRHDRDRLLFANPASARRERLTVRINHDEGKTWSPGRVLHGGPSAYSCLTVLPDLTIGCLYERGEKNSYEKIAFARFTLEWLTEGRDRLTSDDRR